MTEGNAARDPFARVPAWLLDPAACVPPAAKIGLLWAAANGVSPSAVSDEVLLGLTDDEHEVRHFREWLAEFLPGLELVPADRPAEALSRYEAELREADDAVIVRGADRR